jgi:acetyltransferase-like isoleucine patch superfamily enzyme
MKLISRPLSETSTAKAIAYALSYAKLWLFGVSVGRGLRANNLVILNRGSIRIGNNVLLRSNPDGAPYRVCLRTYYPEARIEIRDNARLAGAAIHANCMVVVGSQARIAPGSIISDNDSHPVVRSIAGRSGRPKEAPVHIGENVWLGTRTIVLKGVTIGANTIVAAGSIVTSDLPANVLAAGAPAKPIRALQEN